MNMIREKLLADECVPRRIVTTLRDAGFDVLSVQDLCSGEPDNAILNLAYQETRIILTLDKDFGELVFRRKLPAYGVIIIHLPGLPSADQAKRVASVLKKQRLKLSDMLTVIESKRVRQRRFGATT